LCNSSHKKDFLSWWWWHTPVLPATQEAEVEDCLRAWVRAQPGQCNEMPCQNFFLYFSYRHWSQFPVALQCRGEQF
jgi:hypothetical protein